MKMPKNIYVRFKLFVTCFFVLVFATWSNTAAANNSSHTDGWHFLIAPYLWASSVSGDVTVKGNTRDFHVSFADILKHFDFGAQAHLEAGHGPWTLMLDSTYLKLSDDRDKGLIRPSITSQIVLIDAGVFYRIFSTPLHADQFLSFEILGGARYLSLDNQMDFPMRLSLSDRTQMTTPIVGGRLKADLTPKTYVWLRGDVGGFHIGHVNNTWSGSAGIAYSINSHLDLGIAYHVLKIDFNKGNAAMNVLMYGPMLGAAVRF